MKPPNPRPPKIHRAYTVEQAARLSGKTRNTVRAWIKAGLPAIAGRPVLIEGRELRAFHERRRKAAKRPCPPGAIYCCKCREPRTPEPASMVFEVGETATGNVRAICATCGTRMFQRARQSRLEAKFPGLTIRIAKAPPHIAECPPPSANCA